MTASAILWRSMLSFIMTPSEQPEPLITRDELTVTGASGL
jgi:hypothetical protein